MEHARAIALMETAADGEINLADRTALERHLAECADCRLYAQNLEAMEARLHRSLGRRYPARLAEPQPPAALLSKIRNDQRRIHMSRSTLRTTAWLALALVFIFALNWVFRTLTPIPKIGSGDTPVSTPSATTESGPAPSQPAPSIPAPSIPAPPTSLPSSPPTTPEPSASSLFPDAQFTFGSDLPDSPGSLPIYVQQLPQPASAESVAQTARRLGLDAPVFQRQGEGSDPVFDVSDGFDMLTFAYSTSEIFNYWRDYPDVLSENGELPAFEQAAAAATTYLQEHGLLDMPYRVEPIPQQPGGVHFVRLLDNLPLIYGIGYSPSLDDLEVVVGPDLKVKELTYATRHFIKGSEVPILSAQQAWARFLESQDGSLMRYAINPPDQTNTLQSWTRQYPSGQLIHLYGYAGELTPANPGGTPLNFLDNYPVAGDQAQALGDPSLRGRLLHAWGQFVHGTEGHPSFEMQGWELSPFEDLYLDGKIERQGNQAWLAADQGRYLLPDLPAEVPAGESTSVRGVESTPGELDWSLVTTGQPASSGYSRMDTCGGGGGGGGGQATGGGNFAVLHLNPSDQTQVSPAPTGLPAPYKPGDQVDGATGRVVANQHIYPDGRQALEVSISGDPVGDQPGWFAALSGPNIQDLTQYQSLPVRIWGKVSGLGADGWPVIEVERFEEAYPGLRFQAWLGTWQPVYLEDKTVLLFTDNQGKQYVLSGSIRMGTDAAIGRQGDSVIIEGLAIPGETFGGYPVIDESAGGVADGRTDLNGYQISSGQVHVWDESGGLGSQPAQVQGTGTVEQVELAYAAASLQRCGGELKSDPEQAPWLYVQPVWRFSGHFEDGRSFEIQVQAMPEEYLK